MWIFRRDEFSLLTGLSCLGKSSLKPLHLIMREVQRRSIWSHCPSHARQVVRTDGKPNVERKSKGFSPAISIDQKSTNRTEGQRSERSRRSTTISGCFYGSDRSTLTLSKVWKRDQKQTVDQMVDRSWSPPERTKIQLTPWSEEEKGSIRSF